MIKQRALGAAVHRIGNLPLGLLGAGGVTGSGGGDGAELGFEADDDGVALWRSRGLRR